MKLRRISAVCLCAISLHIEASPWITAQDSSTKHSIDLLVSHGLINRPVNQYPLFWQGIAEDLSNIDSTKLSEQTAFAVSHLRHALSIDKRTTRSGIKAHYHKAPSTRSGLGENTRAKSGIQSFGELTSDIVSARVQVNYADDALDGKSINHHGSHVAVLLGDWALSAERLDYWWGPGNETALLLSNNASPMKAVRLSRANTNYSGPNFLSFVGPWQITAIIAKQQPHEQEGDFWGARFSASPLPGLELGFATTGSDFVYLTPNNGEESKKQRITSIDFKYSTLIGVHPFAVYGEYTGDNESGALPDQPMFTLGIESYWAQEDSRTKAFIEYSDTVTDCNAQSSSFQCHFETPGNGSDYREKGQWLGASIGPQAKSLTVSADYFQTNGVGGFIKLKRSEFEALQLDRTFIEVGYQQGVLSGLMKASFSIWKDKTPQLNDTQNALSFSWEYQF
ncbi:capsule assembly Wzi family protein [Pseudoalteromonas luteoviolacea]|uniref:capsule assembly Wzi family protein n=1 Tax=Pseudoalteromonas luteoviolacea TaxID=43657 RepID=UPI0011547890|nr:capsule assembly Wzi family protein [Pseudoalteromonas luteoviolacea]TQF72159.1 capsule assembly Wzi family protein [Pseudoalteromonas luteoviolacea]